MIGVAMLIETMCGWRWTRTEARLCQNG